MQDSRITITIRHPLDWWEQYNWVMDNCNTAEDITEWAAWKTGHSYIQFRVVADDAVFFKLKFE